MRSADRKYLRFVIAAFALLGLAAAAALLYRPLKVRYAIHKVHGASNKSKYADKWLMVCVDAASGGNRRAMETVIDNHSMSADSMRPSYVGYLAAKSKPALFFDVLSGREDQDVLAVMDELCESTVGYRYGASPETLVVCFEQWRHAASHEDSFLVDRCLRFIKNRFAKELAKFKARGEATSPARVHQIEWGDFLDKRGWKFTKQFKSDNKRQEVWRFEIKHEATRVLFTFWADGKTAQIAKFSISARSTGQRDPNLRTAMQFCVRTAIAVYPRCQKVVEKAALSLRPENAEPIVGKASGDGMTANARMVKAEKPGDVAVVSLSVDLAP